MIVADSSDFEFLQDNFIPNETTPFLTIKISFHIWRDTNGNGNFWLDTPEYRDTLQQVVKSLNWIFNDNVEFSDPIESALFIPDSIVNFEIDSVYYYDNYQAYHLPSYVITNFPERVKSFAYHLSPYFDSTYAGVSSGIEYPYPYCIAIKQTPNNVSVWPLAQHMAHEFGHSFDLHHTYDYNNSLKVSNPEFLWDVFGVELQSW